MAPAGSSEPGIRVPVAFFGRFRYRHRRSVRAVNPPTGAYIASMGHNVVTPRTQVCDSVLAQVVRERTARRLQETLALRVAPLHNRDRYSIHWLACLVGYPSSDDAL